MQVTHTNERKIAERQHAHTQDMGLSTYSIGTPHVTHENDSLGALVQTQLDGGEGTDNPLEAWTWGVDSTVWSKQRDAVERWPSE